LSLETRDMVDIIVPVYNQDKLVTETIHSVQKQTYRYWRLITIDDGSTDQSLKILTEFSENDERIEVVTTGDVSEGACHARNTGFGQGHSPYVMFLDSDDLLSETCLEARVGCFQVNSELDFVLGNTLLFDAHPHDLDILWNKASLEAQSDLLRFLRQDMPWHTMSPMWRRESFSRLGGWNETLTASQDWELHIRACFLNMRYELSGSKPDSFYRRPSQERTSIASSHLTAQNTLARRLAMQSVTNLEGFLNSVERREHVEAFCLRNALQLLDANRQSEASRFLWGCIKDGLFRPLHALGAIAILLRGPNWRGSRVARSFQSYFWSADCRVDPWQKVQCSA